MKIRGTAGVIVGVSLLLFGLLVMAIFTPLESEGGLTGAALAFTGMLLTWWSHVYADTEF